MGRKIMMPAKIEIRLTGKPSFIFHLRRMDLNLIAKCIVNSAMAGIASCK